MMCEWCHRKGHLAKDCETSYHKLNRNQQRHNAHNVDAEETFGGTQFAKARLHNTRETCSATISERYIEAHCSYATCHFNSTMPQPLGVANIATTNSSTWIMDTGAMQHMTCHRDYFQALDTNVTGLVHIADKSSQPIEGMGTVCLTLLGLLDFKLLDVLYIPSLKQNLLSLSTLVSRGFDLSVIANNKTLQVIHPPSNSVVMTGKLMGKLFHLTGNSSIVANHAHALCVEPELAYNVTLTHHKLSKEALWHARMGHIKLDRLKKIYYSTLGLPKFSSNLFKCEACIIAKSHRQPFP